MSSHQDIYHIDQGNLDKDWINFPKKFFRAATDLADKKQAFEKAKADRDLTEAELDKEIRSEYESNQQKVTEKIVEHAITRHERMQKVVKRYIVAKHDMDVAQVYVDTLDGVKKALENNVSLFGMNYFSKPKAKGDQFEAQRKMERDQAFGRKRRGDD